MLLLLAGGCASYSPYLNRDLRHALAGQIPQREIDSLNGFVIWSTGHGHGLQVTMESWAPLEAWTPDFQDEWEGACHYLRLLACSEAASRWDFIELIHIRHYGERRGYRMPVTSSAMVVLKRRDPPLSPYPDPAAADFQKHIHLEAATKEQIHSKKLLLWSPRKRWWE